MTTLRDMIINASSQKKGNKTVKQNKRLPWRSDDWDIIVKLRALGEVRVVMKLASSQISLCCCQTNWRGNTRLLNMAWLDWSKFYRLDVCACMRWCEPLQSHSLCVVGGFGRVPVLGGGASLKRRINELVNRRRMVVWKRSMIYEMRGLVLTSFILSAL